MKILQIIATLDVLGGGPADGAHRLGQVWAESGHEVCVVTLDHPGADYLQNLPYDVVALGKFGQPGGTDFGKFSVRFGYSRAFEAWLRAHAGEFDLIVVHALWNFSTLAARRVLAGSGKPYFVFPHGSLSPWFKQEAPLKHFIKQFVWPFNEGRLMNAASAALFTTRAERDLAKGIYRPYRITPEVVGFGSVAPPEDAAAQVAQFRATVPALGDRRFILFMSRIHPTKGCDLLIRAFAGIAAEHPDLDLVMAGPDQTGLQAQLQSLAQELGVANRIHWPGLIVGAAKWGAYRCADGFALTSHTENFGIVVAEALSCGLPVLITDKVNIWQEVAEDGAGLVEPDTQDGADALLRGYLALPDDRRAAMRVAARRCYDKHFRIEATAQRIVEVARKYGVAG